MAKTCPAKSVCFVCITDGVEASDVNKLLNDVEIGEWCCKCTNKKLKATDQVPELCKNLKEHVSMAAQRERKKHE